MEFNVLIKSIHERVQKYPRKWSDFHILVALEDCESIADLNKVLRYCKYADDLNQSLQGKGKGEGPHLDTDHNLNLHPDPSRALVAGKAMALLLLLRAQLLLRFCRCEPTFDPSRILRDLKMAFRSQPKLSPKFLWKILIAQLESLAVMEAGPREGTKTLGHRRLRKAKLGMFEGCCRNQSYPALSDRLEVRYSPEKGRHVVAREAIEACDIVCMEQSVASIVFDSQEFASKEQGGGGQLHCAHCSTPTFCVLPCPSCCDVHFCSPECLASASASYHVYECRMRLYGILRDLVKGLSNVSVGKMIALRLVTLSPPAFFADNLEALEASLLDTGDDDEEFGPEYLGNHGTCRHHQPPVVETLVGPKQDDDEPALHQYLQLLGLARVGCDRDHSPFVDALQWLLSTSGYFSGHSGLSWDKKTSERTEKLIGALMRRFICIIEANSFALEKPAYETQKLFLSTKNGETYFDFFVHSHQIGTALYLNASMVNHSCDPNLCFVFDSVGNIALATTRSVEAGEELNISYGPVYCLSTREQRAISLKPYQFSCSCSACSSHWPTGSSIPRGVIPQFMAASSPHISADEGDILTSDMMMPDMNQGHFHETTRSLDEAEEQAKQEGDLGGLMEVCRRRGGLFKWVKRPHYCHLKTLSQINAYLWFTLWQTFDF